MSLATFNTVTNTCTGSKTIPAESSSTVSSAPSFVKKLQKRNTNKREAYTLQDEYFHMLS